MAAQRRCCPVWEPDGPACRGCGRSFSLRLRRHHCRYCGQLLCEACSARRLRLDRWLLGPPDDRGAQRIARKHGAARSEPQRVCDTCHEHAPLEMDDRAGALAAQSAFQDAAGDPASNLGTEQQPWQLPGCLVIARHATARRSSALSSEELMTLQPGMLVHSGETTIDSGHQRVCIQEGRWISVRTAKGRRLARPVPHWVASDSSGRQVDLPPRAPDAPSGVQLRSVAADELAGELIAIVQQLGWAEVLMLEWAMPAGCEAPLHFDFRFGLSLIHI